LWAALSVRAPGRCAARFTGLCAVFLIALRVAFFVAGMTLPFVLRSQRLNNER
jgi:hypothetical protein